MPLPLLALLGTGLATAVGAKIVYDWINNDDDDGDDYDPEKEERKRQRKKLKESIKQDFRNQFGIELKIKKSPGIGQYLGRNFAAIKVLENPILESAQDEIEQLDTLLEALEAHKSISEAVYALHEVIEQDS